jgi:hypothetical protein
MLSKNRQILQSNFSNKNFGKCIKEDEILSLDSEKNKNTLAFKLV